MIETALKNAEQKVGLNKDVIKNNRIDKVVDNLRKKYGFKIIQRGSILKEMQESNE